MRGDNGYGGEGGRGKEYRSRYRRAAGELKKDALAQRVLFAARLKAVRQQRQITQADMARFLDISQQLLSKYERHRLMPSFAQVRKIGSVLGVSEDWLIDETDITVDINKLTACAGYSGVFLSTEEHMARENFKKPIKPQAIKPRWLNKSPSPLVGTRLTHLETMRREKEEVKSMTKEELVEHYFRKGLQLAGKLPPKNDF